MKVTVLMVVYNGEKYLVECVNSIINQTFSAGKHLIYIMGCILHEVSP